MSIVYAADLFSQGHCVAVVMPKLTRPCEVSGYIRRKALFCKKMALNILTHNIDCTEVRDCRRFALNCCPKMESSPANNHNVITIQPPP